MRRCQPRVQRSSSPSRTSRSSRTSNASPSPRRSSRALVATVASGHSMKSGRAAGPGCRPGRSSPVVQRSTSTASPAARCGRRGRSRPRWPARARPAPPATGAGVGGLMALPPASRGSPGPAGLGRAGRGGTGGGQGLGPSSTGRVRTDPSRSTVRVTGRRRHQVGPVRPGQRQPQPVPGREHPRGRVQLQLDRLDLARAHRLRVGPRPPLGQVEEPAGHQGRGPVGEHVTQLGRQERHRRRRPDPHRQPRVAEDLQLLLQWPVVDQERPSPDRWSPGCPNGRCPAQLIQAALPTSPRTSRRSTPSLAGPPRPGGAAARRRAQGPGGLVAPDAEVLVQVGGGQGRVADEHRHRRGLVDTIALLRQPAVPPADHLRYQVDPGPGQGVSVGRGSRARTAAGSAPQRLHPEGGAAVAVGPAGHQHRRAGDPLVGRHAATWRQRPSACSSHRSSHGSRPSTRSRHYPARPVPATAGTGAARSGRPARWSSPGRAA